MKKFLIIRLSSLGDIIHTLPAFSALRKHFPESKITWLVEEKGADILELVPGIDRILVTPLKSAPLFSRKFRKDLSTLRQGLKNKEQIALDFQGLVKSGFFSWFSGAKKRFGFHKSNCRETQASWFYTEKASLFPENAHVIMKNLHLLTLLGIKEDTIEFPLVISDELSQSMRSRLEHLGIDPSQRIIVLNLGAAWQTKRLPPQKWIRIIELLERPSVKLVLLWGTQTELELAEQVHSQTKTLLLPDLSLKEVLALIKTADLLVTGDTFALQAACALSKPTVSFFGPTNPERNGPYLPDKGVVFHRLDCSCCYKRTCESMECLKRITPEEIASLCQERLGNP